MGGDDDTVYGKHIELRKDDAGAAFVQDDDGDVDGDGDGTWGGDGTGGGENSYVAPAPAYGGGDYSGGGDT